MSTGKRAWLYVIRKKTKSILLLLILFFMETTLISSLTVKRAGEMMKQQIQKSIHSAFVLKMEQDREGNADMEQEDVEKIADLKEIQESNFRLKGEAALKYQKLVELPQNNIQVQEEESEEPFVTIIGNSNSALNDGFLNQTMELKEGRHIQSKDSQTALIHEKFAEENCLRVGSDLYLTGADGTKERVLKIVGIYLAKNEGVVLEKKELVENRIYTNLSSAQILEGKEKKITEAAFRVKDAEQLKETIQQAKKFPLPWEKLQIEDNAQSYQSVLQSTNRMQKMMDSLILSLTLVSVTVLSLILVFWVRGRVQETGILLSVGVSKWQIIWQYILEVMMIGLPSFVCASVCGQMAAERFAKTFLQNIELSVRWQELGAAGLIGTGIVTLSVAAASMAIIRLKPKEILSKMS